MNSQNNDKELVNQDRLLNNIAIFGRVTSTNYTKEMGLVRVSIASDKEKEAQFELPWLRRRGGNDWEWWAPEVDEQVLIICPDGDLSRAVIVGCMPYSKNKKSITPAKKGFRYVLGEKEKEPKKDAKVKKENSAHFVQYEDKTITSYDKKKHIFQASFLEKKVIDIKLDATKDKEQMALKVKDLSFSLDATKDKEKANLAVKNIKLDFSSEKDKEKIDIKVKDMTLSIDATKDKESLKLNLKGIKVTANAKSGNEELSINVKDKSKVKMDSKGNITIEGKDVTLKLKDDGTLDIDCKKLNIKSGGDVDIDCKKLNVKSSGDVAIKGSSIKLNC